jgi:hypothetical protein
MSEVGRAIARGSAYLLAQQDAEGLWPGSVDRSGEGSHWVTGYVTKALWFLISTAHHAPGVDQALEASRHALTRRQRGNGGWGLTRAFPTEADTTGWALWAMLDEPGRALFSLNQGRRYLRSHWDPSSGGFRPSIPGLDVPPGSRAVLGPAGILEPEPSVTAVAVRALIEDPADPMIQAACRYLKNAQDEDGLWRSPLWAVSGCATLTALGALFVADVLDEATLDASRHGLEVLMKEAHGYELASALMAAPRLGLSNVRNSIDRLLAEQDGDGAWAPSSPVRALPLDGNTRTNASPRSGSERAYEDRLLTTSAALGALGVQQ